jgi:hypothetical protein
MKSSELLGTFLGTRVFTQKHCVYSVWTGMSVMEFMKSGPWRWLDLNWGQFLNHRHEYASGTHWRYHVRLLGFALWRLVYLQDAEVYRISRPHYVSGGKQRRHLHCFVSGGSSFVIPGLLQRQVFFAQLKTFTNVLGTLVFFSFLWSYVVESFIFPHAVQECKG